MLLQGIILVLLLGLAPVCVGLGINELLKPEDRSLGFTYIAGFLILLAMFQLMAVPVVFKDPFGFPTIVRVFNSSTVIIMLVGIGAAFRSHKRKENIWRKRQEFANRSLEEKLLWGVVLLLIFFQVAMAVTHASFDGDDAYYVVQSVLTDETDTLYRIRPYTGLSTNPDMRHAMAVFPLWIAYLARMSGIPATIISHTVLPVVLIPMTYWIYLEIGKKLFRGKEKQLPIYMILLCALQIFGNVSIYPNATFLLMRTWQGKSVLANIVFPAIFMVLLWFLEEQEGEREQKPRQRNRAGLWLLLLVLNLVAAMMSTASALLNVVLIGIMALVFAAKEKKISLLFKFALTCIPCVVYGLLYVII